MHENELRASELLLDVGVAVPVRPLRFLGRKWGKRFVVMHTPYQGTLIRMARIYLQMGVSYNEVKNYNYEQNMEFIGRHGKLLSRMVACSLVRGYITGKLFGRIVSWWLRWRVHPLYLQEAWFQMLTLMDVKSFQTIIKSAGMMNLMRPRLSQK